MSHLPIHRLIIVISVLFCSAAFLQAATAVSQDEQIRQSIRTLNSARTNIVRHHLSQKNRPQTAQTTSAAHQEEDFLLFLHYLDGRIFYYCELLYTRNGSDALADLPCPTSPGGELETTSYSALPAAGSQTDQEKTAGLDDELQASLGSFDDMLLKEQEQISRTVQKQRESSIPPGSGGDRKPGYPSDQSISTEKGQATAGKAATSSTSQKVSKSGSNRGTGAGSTKQTRLPPTSGSKDLSQSDDDIVARQLREAAEQETDPEIKAKLWEEYRNYKEGVQ